MDPTTLIVRPLAAGEEAAACRLVREVFDEFESPEYSEQGIREFFSYADPAAMRRRREEDHFVLVGEIDGEIAGVIEIRHHEHIALLFVKKVYHGRGIARRLFETVRSICLESNPELETMTVNSSPFAVRIYRRMGFIPLSEEQESNGIRYVPMACRLRDPSGASASKEPA